MCGFYDKNIDANLFITWSSNPNKNDTSLKKMKIKFEKCDTIKTCPKTLVLLELNRMTPQGQSYLNKSDLIFIPTKITC
jgi:hypothetical protein